MNIFFIRVISNRKREENKRDQKDPQQTPWLELEHLEERGFGWERGLYPAGTRMRRRERKRKTIWINQVEGQIVIQGKEEEALFYLEMDRFLFTTCPSFQLFQLQEQGQQQKQGDKQHYLLPLPLLLLPLFFLINLIIIISPLGIYIFFGFQFNMFNNFDCG